MYKAYTEPQLVKRWLLARPAGRCRSARWTCAAAADTGGAGAATRTVGDGYPGNDAIVTVSFTEEVGVTTVTTLIDFGSKEARDAAVATGMTDGS